MNYPNSPANQCPMCELRRIFPGCRLYYEDDDGELLETPWHVDYGEESASFGSIHELRLFLETLHLENDIPEGPDGVYQNVAPPGGRPTNRDYPEDYQSPHPNGP